VPVFAIGGIGPERAATVVGTGAHGVAVRTAILAAADPAAAARALSAALAAA
jgi:thiamine-phosphate pyrophosphorylase